MAFRVIVELARAKESCLVKIYSTHTHTRSGHKEEADSASNRERDCTQNKRPVTIRSH
jgi:hypothetical protein